ncbi:Sterol 3-beta-glucosyltransferase UGT80B1, partial [Fusarium albosuccineum]
MPWSSTRAFPHPLANLKRSDHTSQQSRAMTNFISYSMVEWMTWQGVGDIVNDWRRSLDLEPVAMSEGPGLADTLRVPFTYCWSPALIAKPADWGPQIDVCGFFFRDMPSYNPPSELMSFLEQGSRPIYIGFGSIVIDDPDKTTAILLEAIEQTGVRAIVSKGWSKLGDSKQGDSNIYFIDDCPHEWLFQHVSAVMHHGGAGTTACGLKHGRPTIVVPFFGDQQFWGDMVAAAGAGPPPIPYRSLSPSKLAESIKFCLKLEAQIAAQDMSRTMARENGVENAVRSFHANLPLSSLPCDILSDRPAVFQYRYKSRCIKLSGVAGQVLLDHLRVGAKKLDLYSSFETTIDNPRWDPVTGAASAAMG